jgi:hypothetical protein
LSQCGKKKKQNAQNNKRYIKDEEIQIKARKMKNKEQEKRKTQTLSEG